MERDNYNQLDEILRKDGARYRKAADAWFDVNKTAIESKIVKAYDAELQKIQKIRPKYLLITASLTIAIIIAVLITWPEQTKQYAQNTKIDLVTEQLEEELY